MGYLEVSAINFSGGVGLHARSPLLRLQSDERLVALVRRGSAAAFEVLVARYEQRLLAFCRHLLGSREDAEDVLQEVMAAAFHALIADERPINVRPWLYRIARNRCLNLLRRSRPPGVGLIDLQFSDFGATAADKVDEREDFRALMQDIQLLPETQRTALVLREMEALSYEQIAETMETTVSGIKSLLVRARVSLAEAAEARQISCEEVREELGEIAEGLRRRSTPPVRRHLAGCQRCAAFKTQLRQTNRALAALLPLGPLVVLRRLVLSQLGHHAGSGAAGAGSTAASSTAASSTAAGSTAAGTTAAGSTVAGGSLVAGSSPGLISAGLGAIATKAAVGLAAAALVTAAGVEVDHLGNGPTQTHYRSASVPGNGSSAGQPAGAMAAREASTATSLAHHGSFSSAAAPSAIPSSASASRGAVTTTGRSDTTATTASTTAPQATTAPVALTTPTASATTPATVPAATTTESSGVTQTETITTVLDQGGLAGSTGGGSATTTGTTTSTGTQPSSGSGGTGAGTTGSGSSGSGTTGPPPPPPPPLQPPPPSQPPPPWPVSPPSEPQSPPPPPPSQ